MRLASWATRPSGTPLDACSGDITRSTVTSNGDATAAALVEECSDVSIELSVRSEPVSACLGNEPDQAPSCIIQMPGVTDVYESIPREVARRCVQLLSEL